VAVGAQLTADLSRGPLVGPPPGGQAHPRGSRLGSHVRDGSSLAPLNQTQAAALGQRGISVKTITNGPPTALAGSWPSPRAPPRCQRSARAATTWRRTGCARRPAPPALGCIRRRYEAPGGGGRPEAHRVGLVRTGCGPFRSQGVAASGSEPAARKSALETRTSRPRHLPSTRPAPARTEQPRGYVGQVGRPGGVAESGARADSPVPYRVGAACSWPGTGVWSGTVGGCTTAQRPTEGRTRPGWSLRANKPLPHQPRPPARSAWRHRRHPARSALAPQVPPARSATARRATARRATAPNHLPTTTTPHKQVRGSGTCGAAKRRLHYCTQAAMDQGWRSHAPALFCQA
jgi:hypothetical protein